MKHLVVLASLFLAVACGSKSKGDTADPCKDPCKDKPPGGEPTGPLAAGQWEGMDDHAREEFMEHVVMPAMKAKFQEFDADGFAEFTCATCHGAGAAEGGDHEMPNPDLPVLTAETFQNTPEEDKAIFEFMDATVKPMMAELLGVPMKTETTDGFNCMSCHTFGE